MFSGCSPSFLFQFLKKMFLPQEACNQWIHLTDTFASNGQWLHIHPSSIQIVKIYLKQMMSNNDALIQHQHSQEQYQKRIQKKTLGYCPTDHLLVFFGLLLLQVMWMVWQQLSTDEEKEFWIQLSSYSHIWRILLSLY